MLKRILFIASLSFLSFANAQNKQLPLISQTEKFDIESAMNILKDVENNHVSKNELNEFLNKYDISNSAKNLVLSYNEQDISYSDLNRLDYGVYALKKKENLLKSNVISGINYRKDYKCYVSPSPFGTDYCYSNAGSLCQESSNACW